MSITRRAFLSTSSAAAALMVTGVGRAASLGLPIGLQLYSVRTLLPTDYAGTLKQIGALGYKEVEAAGFFNMPVEQVKTAMKAAGLRCVSAHYPLPLLKQHGFTGTVFQTTGGGGKEGEEKRILNWRELAEIEQAGIEIGAHTCTHPQLDQLPESLMREELYASKSLLEDNLGLKVPGLAYPYGYSSARVRRTQRAMREAESSDCHRVASVPRT